MGLEYNEKVLPIHRPSFILWVVSVLMSAAKFTLAEFFQQDIIILFVQLSFKLC
jgi:hypothetical protein